MIVISGTSGFIGGKVAESLGENVIAIARHNQTKGSNNYQVDLADDKQVDQFISLCTDSDVKAFIHCSGITPWSSLTPDYSADLNMAKNVLKICKALSIERLIYISGWIVYDTISPAPYIEDKTPLLPTTDYGKSKLAVEEYLKENCGDGIQVINVRLASVYGPGQTTAGLIPNLVKTMLQGKDIQLNSKTTKRDYYYIDDLVKTLSDLVKLPLTKNLDVNIGGGSSISVSEVAETIASVGTNLYGLNTKVTFAEPIVEGQPADNALSIELAKNLKVISNQVSIKSGLTNYIKWIKDENLF